MITQIQVAGQSIGVVSVPSDPPFRTVEWSFKDSVCHQHIPVYRGNADVQLAWVRHVARNHDPAPADAAAGR